MTGKTPVVTMEDIKQLQDQVAFLELESELKKQIANLEQKIGELSKTPEPPEDEAPPEEEELKEPEDEPQPAASAKGLAGDIAVEKAGYLAEIVAYRVLKGAAEKVSDAINKANGVGSDAKILVVGDWGLARGDLPLLQVSAQFIHFRELLQDQIDANLDLVGRVIGEEPKPPKEEVGADVAEEEEEPPKVEERPWVSMLSGVLTSLGGWATAASGILSSAADIAGYFKVDYTIKERELALPLGALSATVAGALGNRAYMLDLSRVEKSDTVAHLSNLIRQSCELDRSVAHVKSRIVAPVTVDVANLSKQIADKVAEEKEIQEGIAALDKQLEELKAKQKGGQQNGELQHKIDACQKARRELEAKNQKVTQVIESLRSTVEAKNDVLLEANAAIAASEALATTFGEFVKKIATPVNDKTPSLYVQAVLREHVHNQSVTHFLHLGILSDGGEMIIKKRALLSGRAAFVGGCAVSYTLTTLGGQVLASGMEVAASQLEYRFKRPGESRLTPIPFD